LPGKSSNTTLRMRNGRVPQGCVFGDWYRNELAGTTTRANLAMAEDYAVR